MKSHCTQAKRKMVRTFIAIGMFAVSHIFRKLGARFFVLNGNQLIKSKYIHIYIYRELRSGKEFRKTIASTRFMNYLTVPIIFINQKRAFSWMRGTMRRTWEFVFSSLSIISRSHGLCVVFSLSPILYTIQTSFEHSTKIFVSFLVLSTGFARSSLHS